MESSCIKQLDLSGTYIPESELKKFPCLANSVSLINNFDHASQDKLILILFKAVQQLKIELDSLKANKN